MRGGGTTHQETSRDAALPLALDVSRRTNIGGARIYSELGIIIFIK